MRTRHELELLWRDSPAQPRDRGAVRLICLRTGGGEHTCPARVLVTPEGGVEGDRWSRKADASPDTQVTLMSARVAELVAGDTTPLHSAGDNFLVDLDLAEAALPAGARLRIGGAALEVSLKPHTGCGKFRDRFGAGALDWVNHEENRALRLRGVNCRVISGGEVALHDSIEVLAPYERSSG